VLISVEGAGEDQLDPGQESTRDAPLLSHCFLLRNLGPKPTCVLEHCREGETACWFSIFRTFPSGCIAKATKNFNVHCFIHGGNSCKLYQRIPGTF
jgi:hypothetical protein